MCLQFSSVTSLTYSYVFPKLLDLRQSWFIPDNVVLKLTSHNCKGLQSFLSVYVEYVFKKPQAISGCPTEIRAELLLALSKLIA